MECKKIYIEIVQLLWEKDKPMFPAEQGLDKDAQHHLSSVDTYNNSNKTLQSESFSPGLIAFNPTTIL